jgi:hypothetical protein
MTSPNVFLTKLPSNAFQQVCRALHNLHCDPSSATTIKNAIPWMGVCRVFSSEACPSARASSGAHEPLATTPIVSCGSMCDLIRSGASSSLCAPPSVGTSCWAGAAAVKLGAARACSSSSSKSEILCSSCAIVSCKLVPPPLLCLKLLHSCNFLQFSILHSC